MTTYTHTIIERLHTAMNQHDLEAFLACFDPDYHSEQPAHPDRQFAGKDQVRKNWSRIFSSIPDFQAELLRVAVAGEVVWAGTRPDKTPFLLRGITIFAVANDQIIWGRLYMEPVETDGPGIDVSLKAVTQGKLTP